MDTIAYSIIQYPNATNLPTCKTLKILSPSTLSKLGRYSYKYLGLYN